MTKRKGIVDEIVDFLENAECEHTRCMDECYPEMLTGSDRIAQPIAIPSSSSTTTSVIRHADNDYGLCKSFIFYPDIDPGGLRITEGVSITQKESNEKKALSPFSELDVQLSSPGWRKNHWLDLHKTVVNKEIRVVHP